MLTFLPPAIRQRVLHCNHLLHWRVGHWKSVWNRPQTVEEYLEKHRVRKIQFGCWPYLLDGWLNSELYGSKDLLPLDLTKPFPLPDASFDYAFSEHVIEHFSLGQGTHIFNETYRILKPGGWLRMSTPDLAFLIALYSPKKTAVQKRYLKWSSQEFFKELGTHHEAFVINNFVRAWGHQFIYDFESFKILLAKAGFTQIRRAAPGKSKDAQMRHLEHHGQSYTEEFNQLESLVIEARKPLKASS